MKTIRKPLDVGICQGSLTGLQKKSALGFAFFVSLYIVSGYAFGQEMNMSGNIGGHNLDIRLVPNDVTCTQIRVIEVGKLFCARMSITGLNSLQLNELKVEKFDATMPQHRHGMVTRPSIKLVQPGEYLIEGLKMHMAGEWKFTIHLKYRNDRLQVAIPLKL